MADERVSQLPIEVVTLPDTSMARVSHLPIEMVTRPSTTRILISQMIIECVIPNTPTPPLTTGPIWQWILV